MEILFCNNIIAIYFIAIVSIANYSGLEDKQKVILIYIITYGLAFKDIMSIKAAIGVMIIALFACNEWLTQDMKKLVIVTNPFHKICDDLYMSIIQQHILLAFIGIGLNSNWLERRVSYYLKVPVTKWTLGIISVIIMYMCVNSVLCEKIKVKSFTDIMKVFSERPIQNMPLNKDYKLKYKILTSLEDMDYFKRKTSIYISMTIIRRKISYNELHNKYCNKAPFRKSIINHIRMYEHMVSELCNMACTFIKNTFSKDRGYSTIQMQLVRNIALERGYDYTIRRKIFEFVYAPIITKGLQCFFERNNYVNTSHYKEYLLYIYLYNVPTWINGKYIDLFYKVFNTADKRENKNIGMWDVELFFIACMGLCKKTYKIKDERLYDYIDLVHGVNLNAIKIRELYYIFPFIKDSDKTSEVKDLIAVSD